MSMNKRQRNQKRRQHRKDKQAQKRSAWDEADARKMIHALEDSGMSVVHSDDDRIILAEPMSAWKARNGSSIQMNDEENISESVKAIQQASIPIQSLHRKEIDGESVIEVMSNGQTMFFPDIIRKENNK